MDTLKMIGRRIVIARDEKYLDQTQLADAIHVTQKTISFWENGKSEIGTLDLYRLANVLGKSVDWFFEPIEIRKRKTHPLKGWYQNPRHHE